jgi:hypothetical protein
VIGPPIGTNAVEKIEAHLRDAGLKALAFGSGLLLVCDEPAATYERAPTSTAGSASRAPPTGSGSATRSS